MRAFVLVSLVVTFALGGCGRVADSRANPFNWFGGSDEVVVAADVSPEAEALRDDTLLPNVLELEAAPHPGGVILTAKGLAPTQGFHSGELVLVSQAANEMVFELRATAPGTAQPEGAQATREMVVGIFLSQQTMGNASRIVVIAGENRRSVRRR